MDALWVDKLDVARRQTITAVRLFFEEADPVAIHTLVASAHQVLVDIGRKKGIHGAMKRAELLQGDDTEDYLKTINSVFNFMKHADRDAEKKINIEPLQRFTNDFLMDAILLLQKICGNIPIEGKVFWSWFVSTYPEEFENLPPDGPINQMQRMGIEKWDFNKIRQFLEFADVAGDVPLANL